MVMRQCGEGGRNGVVIETVSKTAIKAIGCLRIVVSGPELHPETFTVVRCLTVKHPGLECTAATKPELSRRYTTTATIHYFMVRH